MDKLLDLISDQPLALVTLGVVLALIIGVRYLGLWQGQNAGSAASTASAQVAAVIVDPTALNNAAASVDSLTVAIHGLVVAVKDAAAHSKRTAEELDAIREEMRIHREVSRR